MNVETYSRVYHKLMNEYPSVWRSDAQLALFVRLLVLADKFWPERPPMPRASGSAVRSLVEAGLLIVDDQDCYRVKGLDSERQRRSSAARTAAIVRHAMPRRDETRKDEKGASHDGRHGLSCLVCRPLLAADGGKR